MGRQIRPYCPKPAKPGGLPCRLCVARKRGSGLGPLSTLSNRPIELGRAHSTQCTRPHPSRGCTHGRQRARRRRAFQGFAAWPLPRLSARLGLLRRIAPDPCTLRKLKFRSRLESLANQERKSCATLGSGPICVRGVEHRSSQSPPRRTRSSWGRARACAAALAGLLVEGEDDEDLPMRTCVFQREAI